MYETIILGIACLSAPLFAKYSGFEIYKKPYDMVGVGGLFFLLGAAFALGPSKVDFLTNIGTIGTIVSHVLGWLMVIFGAFRSAIDVLMEKDGMPGAPESQGELGLSNRSHLKSPVRRANSQGVKPVRWHAIKGNDS